MKFTKNRMSLVLAFVIAVMMFISINKPGEGYENVGTRPGGCGCAS